ncbi:hypothetical protein EDD85DRAFT_955906 [Armillaria nabsnona]|nr:hypothetical protein EDD85DRAFT_955906 [Armillaria nabsnona]
MLSTVKIILLSIYIGVSSALFGAAIILAIQFHCKRPSIYINQYNAYSTVNYVLLQQPPAARTHSPIHNNRSTEIHELPRLCSQTIPESRISSHSGTPIIILSSTTSSTPYVIQTPSPIPAPDLAEQLCRFQVVQRSIRRPGTLYPATATSSNTRDIDTMAPATFNPDTLWDSLTPSTFLSVSTFLPPRESIPEPCAKDPEYPSIINWDQPVPGSQYEQVSFDKSGAPDSYSQEPTPEPIARPSQPP